MLLSAGLYIWTCLHGVCCLHFAVVKGNVMEGQISHLSDGLDQTRRLCREVRPSLVKMGNRPLFHKEPLAFIDETNVCVYSKLEGERPCFRGAGDERLALMYVVEGLLFSILN